MNIIDVSLFTISFVFGVIIALVVKLIIDNRKMNKDISEFYESFTLIFSTLVKLKEENNDIIESIKRIVDIMEVTREHDETKTEVIRTIVERMNNLSRSSNIEDTVDEKELLN